MSIVIDMDMDMPKYCNECRFCTDSFGECDLKYEYIPNYEFWSDKNEKPEWCPLKSVDEKSKQIPKDDVLDKIRAEILDSAFSVVNPKNTYEYINVLDLDSIGNILDKYKGEDKDDE